MLLLFDLLMRRALGMLGRGSSIRALELENAVLRHEVRLLRLRGSLIPTLVLSSGFLG